MRLEKRTPLGLHSGRKSSENKKKVTKNNVLGSKTLEIKNIREPYCYISSQNPPRLKAFSCGNTLQTELHWGGGKRCHTIIQFKSVVRNRTSLCLRIRKIIIIMGDASARVIHHICKGFVVLVERSERKNKNVYTYQFLRQKDINAVKENVIMSAVDWELLTKHCGMVEFLMDTQDENKVMRCQPKSTLRNPLKFKTIDVELTKDYLQLMEKTANRGRMGGSQDYKDWFELSREEYQALCKSAYKVDESLRQLKKIGCKRRRQETIQQRKKSSKFSDMKVKKEKTVKTCYHDSVSFQS